MQDNQKKKILIIEDEEILRELLKRKLEEVGYRVLTASDGKSGLDLIRKERPNLILSDIVLPNINGFEIMKIVKGDKELKNIPIVVISNSGMQEDIKKSFELGAKDYITKVKFDPWEIVEKIKGYKL